MRLVQATDRTVIILEDQQKLQYYTTQNDTVVYANRIEGTADASDYSEVDTSDATSDATSGMPSLVDGEDEDVRA